MKVRVRHRIDRLAHDQAEVLPAFAQKAPRVVRRNADLARDLWKAIAREKAGPHGQAFHKRISSERTGPLEAEAGPTGTPKTEFVGVGYRHGRNTDLPKVADKAESALAADVRKMYGELFR